MQQALILEAIRKTMKSRGYVYKDLATGLKLSLPTIKRMLTKGDIPLSRLFEICQFLEIEMKDLFLLIDKGNGVPEVLTEEQELFLARKPERLAYLELLLEGMKPRQIEKEFNKTPQYTEKVLSELDKWKLIDWLPGNKVRFRTGRDIQLRRGGPLRTIIEEKGIKSFLGSSFENDLDVHDFVTFKASEQTLKKFNTRLKKLVRETMQEGHFEESSDIPTLNIGTFLAVRKWRIADIFGV